jgi:hypothetical protein
MAKTVVKGLTYPKYSGTDTFSNRYVDNLDNNGLSPIDNLISPLEKEFIWKESDVESKVKVDFLNSDNGWHFPNMVIQSIVKLNK